MRTVLAAAAAAAWLATVSAGQMVLHSQSRTVYARASWSMETATAPDFTEFNQSVSVRSPIDDGIVSASQRSTLSAAGLNGSGACTPGSGAAFSHCAVEFDIATACSFRLEYGLVHGGVSLTGPGTSVDTGVASQGGTRQGVLAPGRYTFVAHTDGGSVLPPAPGSFNFNLIVTPLTTGFTYQGRLESGGAPVEGSADFRFMLYRGSGGREQVGPTLELPGATVSRGLFTTELDFGAVQDGTTQYLEIWVRSPAGAGSYTRLTPREKLNATPRALWAMDALSAGSAQLAHTAESAPWSGITGVPPNVSGAYSPFSPDALGITTPSAVGIGGASLSADALGVWGGITVDAGQANAGTAPLNNTEFLGVRFGAPTGGEGIGSSRLSGSPTQFGLDFFTGRQLRMTIQNAGRVGINTTAPDATLSVNGTASKPGGGSWATFSDPRLKHDVKPLTGTLDTLLSLHGYTFEYTREAVASGRALPGTQMGLMADEVERVFPDWVTRGEDGMRMVTERATTALMVEALRDLRREKDREVGALREELAERDRALAELRARIEAVERR